MRYLFYQGAISHIGVKNAQTLAKCAVDEGEKELTLCISSAGGDVTSGVGLFNFLQLLPIKVHTHASGVCNSIAATIFLVGEKRTASPLSAFTTHQSTFVEGPLIGQRAPNTDLIAQPFKTVAKWSDQDIRNRFGANDFNFSAKKARELGVVTDIIPLTMLATDTIQNVNVP